VGFAPGGNRDRWVEPKRRRDSARLPSDLSDIADLGLTLAQGKRLVALVQQEIVTAQSRNHAARRPDCRTCIIPSHVKGYRPHRSLPCLVRLRCDCPASAAPVAAARRLGTAGQHIAARHPNSTKSGRSFPPACSTGSLMPKLRPRRLINRGERGIFCLFLRRATRWQVHSTSERRRSSLLWISLLIYVIDDAPVCGPAVSMERAREVGSMAETPISCMVVTLLANCSA
jgi:hypothetical protein